MQFKSFMEALKGKQHKIDKNKNGQIDSHDFKLLRKEEQEEVAERYDPNRAALAKQRISNLRHAGRKVAGARIANLLRTAGIREESEVEDELIEQLDEVLGKDAGADKWITDFVHSTNPKFDGKSKKERINMALGAYYDTHKKKDGISEGNGYDDNRRGFGRAPREDDEYHVPDPTVKKTKLKKEEVEDLEEGGHIPGTTPWHHSIDTSVHKFKPSKNKTGPRTGENPMSAEYKPHKPTNVPAGAVTKEAVQKVDVPAYLRKQQGQAPLKLSDLKRKDTISDKDNLAKLRNEQEEPMKSFTTIMKECEQIDELNTDTLKSYINKAKPQMQAAKSERQSARETGDYKTAGTAGDTVNKRTDGIKAAKAKLNKEESEQLDEISLDTMNSAKDKLKDRATDAHMDDNKYAARHYAGRYMKMKAKIAQKQRQVTKEEVENLEEGRNEGDVPFDKPYKTVTTPVVKDKSGAKHTPMSRARELARQGMKQAMKEEYDVEITDEVADQILEAAKQFTGPVNVDKVHAAGQEPHEEKWVPAKKKTVKEEIDADGNVTYAPMTYNDFMMVLEYEADKGGRYVHKGSYGSEFAKAEREKDEKGFDAEPAKRGPKAGSKRGPRANLGNSKLHKTI